MPSSRHAISRTVRVLAALLAAALLLAACGDDNSETDEAREKGETLGEAIAGLEDVSLEDGPEDLEAQVDTIEAAADDLLTAGGETLSDQIDQAEAIVVDALNQAVAAAQQGNFGEAAEAIEAGFAELESTVTEFSESNDEVVQAAWEGVESGLESGDGE